MRRNCDTSIAFFFCGVSMLHNIVSVYYCNELFTALQSFSSIKYLNDIRLERNLVVYLSSTVDTRFRCVSVYVVVSLLVLRA